MLERTVNTSSLQVGVQHATRVRSNAIENTQSSDNRVRLPDQNTTGFCRRSNSDPSRPDDDAQLSLCRPRHASRHGEHDISAIDFDRVDRRRLEGGQLAWLARE